MHMTRGIIERRDGRLIMVGGGTWPTVLVYAERPLIRETLRIEQDNVGG